MRNWMSTVEAPRRTALAAAMAALLCAGPTSASACGEVFRGEMVTSEREVGATPAGEDATFHVLGAGWFHAVEVVKRGGVSDDTLVTLELDGEPMVTASFADLKNPMREVNTQYMILNVRENGDSETLTIWYAPELKFRAMAAVRVEVREGGVESLKMRTVMNKPAPHEHLLGQAGAVTANASALPVFK
jgi:hypothetical protein